MSMTAPPGESYEFRLRAEDAGGNKLSTSSRVVKPLWQAVVELLGLAERRQFRIQKWAELL